MAGGTEAGPDGRAGGWVSMGRRNPRRRPGHAPAVGGFVLAVLLAVVVDISHSGMVSVCPNVE